MVFLLTTATNSTTTPVDFSIFENIFKYGQIGHYVWVIPLLLIFISMILISRQPEQWKILLLPISVGFYIILDTATGMMYLLFVIGGIMLALSSSATKKVFGMSLGISGITDKFRRRKERKLKTTEARTRVEKDYLKMQRKEAISRLKKGEDISVIGSALHPGIRPERDKTIISLRKDTFGPPSEHKLWRTKKVTKTLKKRGGRVDITDEDAFARSKGYVGGFWESKKKKRKLSDFE